MESVLIKFKPLPRMPATKSAIESVLVKLQAITMNGDARACDRFSDRICF